MSKLCGYLFFAALFFNALGQESDIAKHIYASSEESVFLVYLNDSNGTPQALGSAFLVAPKTLITNAHVVEHGDPVLAVGPVRIPATVVSRDTENDLAVLSVSVELTSKILSLASSTPAPGERVFAIGNPEGLEKSLSEGLISGVRHVGQRTLLQITSPISHGSSGGPILDSAGKVVGVAVGMLTDGQNLNFAVPAQYISALLNEPASSAHLNSTPTLPEIDSLLSALNEDKYSDDSASPYANHIASLNRVAKSLVVGSNSTADLEHVACIGAERWPILDVGVQAAKKLQMQSHTRESTGLVGYMLLQKFNQTDLDVAFTGDKDPKLAEVRRARAGALDDLSRFMNSTTADARVASTPLYLYVEANWRDAEAAPTAAVPLYQRVIPTIGIECSTDLKAESYRKLIADLTTLGQTQDAENWFRKYAQSYTPTAWEWDAEANRRDAVHDNRLAADANERAANAIEYLNIDYCWAAQERYLQFSGEGDKVLEDGRKCVDASVRNTDADQAKKYNERLPVVQRMMAIVLEDRGVHDMALSYIKSALALSPNDPFSLNEQAVIFENMNRYTECISAAKAAIAASDGKFSFMHFTLGNCYFSAQDWSNAGASFRLSADGDKTDAASAFNLALSYQRQGFSSDARIWFNEALKRNPDASLREKVQNALKNL